MYLFEVTPVGKPRMTQRDKWVTRNATDQYWAYKDELNLRANLQQYKIGNVIDVIFFIPMPASWSEKKKIQMCGMPH